MARKFICVTKDFSGYGFCFDKRLKGNGDKAIIACDPEDEYEDTPEKLEMYHNIGKGMIKVFDLNDIMKNREGFKDWYWIWDGNHHVEENELLCKEGFKVCLGGELMFKMENDRMFGIQLAEEMGIESPLWEEFSTAEEGVKFLEENEEKVFVFKPDAEESYLTTVPIISDAKKANKQLREFIKAIEIKSPFILQERVPGIEVNVEYFCVDGEPLSAQINLESKRISSDDKGCMCGCAFDVCRDVPLDSRIVKETVAKFLPFIKENKWTGLFDMNCIIGEDDIWFIEFCARLGFNAHPNYFTNVSKTDCFNTLADMVDGKYKPEVKRLWGASITGYVDHPHEGIPMFIPDEVKDKVYIFDGMKNEESDTILETGIDGHLVIVCGKGQRVKEAMEDALANMEKLEGIINLDYRADGAKDGYASSPIKRYDALVEWGYL
jgi:phosphoribosylamine-glycine ligase